MEKVLEILQENARTPIEEIARRIDRTVDQVAAQIDQLERDGVILGYRPVLDPKQAEDEIVTGIIEVQLSPQRGSGFDAIAERVYRFPEVKFCYLISGRYDLQLIVEGKSLQEVASFVSEKLSTLEHVRSTATHFILKKYKVAGVILAAPPKTDRLAVSP